MHARGWRRIGPLAAVLVLLCGCQSPTSETDVGPTATDRPASESPTSESPAASSPAVPSGPAPGTETASTLTISAMGDWLPHDSVVADAATEDGGYDFGQFFDAIRPRYEGSDLVFCNQEVPSAGDVLGLSYFPRFDAPAALTTGMVDAGCDTINLANNHMADWGQQGIDITRAQWDALQPTLIGGANRSPEEQQRVSIAEVDGVTVAFLAFTDLSNEGHTPFGLNRLSDTALVESLMAQAVAASDVQMVSVHWGTEYALTANERQVEAAQWLVDLGTDLIIGTGPHVLQPGSWVDRADGTRAFVFFSIGNALSTQIEIPRVLAAIAQIDVVVDAEGTVTVQDPRAIPTYMHYDLTPQQLAANQLGERRNLQVYPLVDAEAAIAASAWRDELTVDSATRLVTDTLGPDVRITS